MKVAIIGSVGVPSKYGGFETLVDQTLPFFTKKVSVFVYCSSLSYKEKISYYKGAKLIYIPIKANGFQSIFYDIISMIHGISFGAKTFLILGVSGCLFLPVLKLLGKKTITNLDGLEWKRSKWSLFQKYYLKLSEIFAVLFSSVIISDNKCIVSYISRTYGIKSVFIPYGGDHVGKNILPISQWNYSFKKGEYAFKVCRIEPENNIDLILDAFSVLKKDLVFVGNWKSSKYGKLLYEKYTNHPYIHLFHPIYETSILDLLRSNCKYYIHGHSAGGTNPSLVEAMYLGLPILAFKVNFNISTTFSEAFYFSTSSELIELLENLNSSKLKACRIKMKDIAKKHYVWEKIAVNYFSTFDTQ